MNYNCTIHTETIDGRSDTVETPRGCSFQPGARIKRTYRTCVDGKCKTEGMTEERKDFNNDYSQQQKINSSTIRETNNIGSNQNISRMDPMFTSNDGFWSSGMDNGIPTSQYSQYDPGLPSQTSGPADSYFSKNGMGNNGVTSSTTSTTGGRPPQEGSYSEINQSVGTTEGEIKKGFLFTGLFFLLFGVFLELIHVSIYGTKLDRIVNGQVEKTPSGLIISGCGSALIGVILMGVSKKAAKDIYEEKKKGNQASSTGYVRDETTVNQEGP